MKVLIIPGSEEDYAFSYANALSRYCSVHLCLPRRQYQCATGFFRPGISYDLLNWPRHRNPRNLFVVASIARIIQATRPDVVHFLTNALPWLSALFFLKRPCPFLVTVHDIAFHPGDRESRKLPSWLIRLPIRLADYIVVHGETLRAGAVSSWGLSPDRVFTLPLIAKHRYLQVAEENKLSRRHKGSFTILFFGRIYPYKGLKYLLLTEQRVTSCVSGARYVIAGRGDDVDRHRAMIRDEARFEIINRRLCDTEVAQVFLDADVVVLPYIEASQSGVLTIAAAFGKPVIVSGVGELPATVREAGMGIVVPPADADALANAIIQLANDQSLIHRYGVNALAYAQADISEEAVGGRASTIYDLIRRNHLKGS